MSMEVIELAGEYAVLTGDPVAIDRSAPGREHTAMIGDIATVNADSGGQARIMEWGRDNCLPNHREALVADNNIVPALMLTRRNIILGRGLMAYTEKIVDGEMVVEEVEIPEAAARFFRESEIEKYFATAARNDVFHAAIPTEYIRYKYAGEGHEKGHIKRIKAMECRHFRLEEQNKNGESRNGYWKGNWGHNLRRTQLQPAQRIPAYNGDDRQPKFFTFEVDDLICLDEYYPTPHWWGSEEWIRLSNKIPQFHDANLEHGYTMRWHIKMPKGYFLDATAYNAATTDDAKKKVIGTATVKKTEFIGKLNDTLQGMKNAGKTIITEFDIDKALGKEYPGIQIMPLSYDMKDEALLKLFEASNAANMSAQGVHPTLANIQTQGKLSSGSEIRNAFLMYVAIHTPLVRQRLLRPINLVSRINGWDPKVKFGFRDMLITRLDEEKSGTTTTNENTPA